MARLAETESVPSMCFNMAPPDGFEPPNDGIKTRCLTTWRRGYKISKFLKIYVLLNYKAIIYY